MILPDYAQLYTSPDGFNTVMEAYNAAVACSPVPYTSQVVCTRHGDTHVLSGGNPSAPPLVIFHSWYSNSSTLGSAFPFLFSFYRVYLPDIIGLMGKSSPNRPPTGGPAYGEWAADLLDGLGIHQAVAVGVSGGGWVVLKLASFASERVSKAVVIGPVGLAPFRSGANKIRSILLSRMAGLLPFRMGQRWAARLLAGPSLSRSPNFENFASTLSRNQKYFRSPNLPGPLTDEELRKVTAPVLIMLGADDIYYNPITVQFRARSLIPGERDVLIFPHTGHLLMEEKPKAARNYILAFLQSPKGARQPTAAFQGARI